MAIPLQRHHDPNVPCPFSLRESEQVEKVRVESRGGKVQGARLMWMLLMSTWGRVTFTHHALSLSESIHLCQPLHCLLTYPHSAKGCAAGVGSAGFKDKRAHGWRGERIRTIAWVSTGHTKGEINYHQNIMTYYHRVLLPSQLSLCILSNSAQFIWQPVQTQVQNH